MSTEEWTVASAKRDEQRAQAAIRERNMDREQRRRRLPIDRDRNRRGLAEARRALRGG